MIEIDEVDGGESDWIMWLHGHTADTGGLCECGHEGLGPAWHNHNCPGAYEALWRKTRELFIALHETSAVRDVQTPQTP